MNEVQVIDPVGNPSWDRFVDRHPYSCVGHLPEWKKVLESSFPHMKGYYFVLKDDGSSCGEIKAALPVFTVKSWLTGNRLVSVPYATLCDPLISGKEDIQLLLPAIDQFARQQRCRNVEIRTFLSRSALMGSRLICADHYVTHQLNLEDSIKSISSRFHRKSVMYSIKKAEKAGFDLQIGHLDEQIARFYDLYLNTRKRLSLPAHPAVFFKNLKNYLAPSGKLVLMLALKGSQPVAGLLGLKHKDRFSVEFNGWDRAFSQDCPNHFLWWEAIKLAKSSGHKVFDFGRTALDNHSLMGFKKRWGTTAEPICHFYQQGMPVKNGLNREGSFSYLMVKKICEHLPNAGFKHFSNFCYRHLG